MRIRTLFMSMVAGMALVGCSSEEDIAPGGGGLGAPQFLRVNLVTNQVSGLRAGGDQSIGDPNKDDPDNHSIYEDGMEAENKVTKVRFYFFDAEGNAAYVKNDNGSLKNYLEWTNVLEDNDDNEGNKDPNVEKKLSTTLIIQSPEKDKVPAKIVAVINPTAEPNEERSLTSLSSVANDYKANTTSGSFVMSNSTYSESGTKRMAVSVDGKIKDTSGEALNDPVNIYVERVIAKVRLETDLDTIPGMPNIYKTSTDSSQKVTLDGKEKEIYVKLLGWNTTAVSNKSRLVKEINAAWSNTLFGSASTPWNWAEYFRCFWAINANGVGYDYGAFVPVDAEGNQIANNKFQAQAKTKFNGKDYVYVNENASPYSADASESLGENASTPTKVIVAAQLVDKSGAALEFAEYGSTRTSINGLKELFANNCGLYKKVTVEVDDEKKTKFIKIAPEDLTIKTATAVGEASKDSVGRYKSFVQLAEDEDNKWYASNKEDAKALTAAEANLQLKSLGSAKVWKNGYTYYYFDINHLGNKFGVVRNHIYDAKIISLAGLGTPVYNPEEIIYPEKPVKDTDTFIAAKIRILSWRVVPSNVELSW